MNILMMQTENWTYELKETEDRSLAEQVDLFIGNTGNLMFMHACRYFIDASYNKYSFYDWYKMNDTPAEYKDYINNNYDMVIYPLANILKANTDSLDNVIRLLEGIKIPIYCIGIGLSLDAEKNFSVLCKAIAKKTQQLVKIVENSGGAFACRGYFTKELLENICGKNDALFYVTGCPSMYQNGLLHIDKKNYDMNHFKPTMNGRVEDFDTKLYKEAFVKYHAEYIDQDQYLWALYNKEKQEVCELVKKYSWSGLQLLAEEKVKYFYSLPHWYQYIKENVNFMCGSRIHGNLISILAEKPAVVYIPKKNPDIRVRELAEFFNIPIVYASDKKKLYDIYAQADYTKFNREYETKFNNFEKFLVDKHIRAELPREKNQYLAEKKDAMVLPYLRSADIRSQLEESKWLQKKQWQLTY